MGEEALVIVHLSSLDAYTWEKGMEAGEELAKRLVTAVLTHPGPVIIVDQGWEAEDNTSQPRVWFVNFVGIREGNIWIYFDEQDPKTGSWDDFLTDLRLQLERLRVKRVRLGGIWYRPDLTSGCVSETYKRLKRYFKVRVDPDLVGCE